MILIGVGLIFLAQNMGLLNPDIWHNIWRFWPVLLVVVGIDLIFRRSNWASAIGVALVIVLVGGIISFSVRVADGFNWQVGERGLVFSGQTSTERIDEEIGGVRQLAVDVKHGAGRLSVSALPDHSGRLVVGSLVQPEEIGAQASTRRTGDRATLSVGPRQNRLPLIVRDGQRQDWDLSLAPGVPVGLEVKSGASTVNLDLSGLKVSRLDVDMAAGELTVTLPQEAGRTEARIKGVAVEMLVIVPEGVAARIQADGILSDTKIDQTRFPRSGKYFQSANYGTATNRVDLELEGAVSDLTIR